MAGDLGSLIVKVFILYVTVLHFVGLEVQISCDLNLYWLEGQERDL